MSNPYIAVIKIGYNSFAFESAEDALMLVSIMAKAVQIEDEAWCLRDQTHQTHFLADGSAMPELKFIAKNKFNPHETVEEIKARFKREAEDRADMEQKMKEAPAALPAPDAIIGADNEPL